MLLEGRDLYVSYRSRTGQEIRALQGVSIAVERGESVAIVGESGSGKSTLIRCLAALEMPKRGRVNWDGIDVASLTARERRQRRAGIQVVFQHALLSFNPRFRVREVIGEPLRNFGSTVSDKMGRVHELIELVGLPKALADEYPAQLSGGQQQRVAIARALAPDPAVLLCDEPLSSLDVSIQAQIIEVLASLRRERGLTLVVVTHNVGIVPYLAGRAVVLREGTVVEEVNGALTSGAGAAYTRDLIAALPRLHSH